MPKRKGREVLTEGVREHQATQAWLQLQAGSWSPHSLELLQQRTHSTVYRLYDVRQDGTRVIAKRCRVAAAQRERMIYQELLPITGLPALECYGTVLEPDGKFCWLFLEDAKDAWYSGNLPYNRAVAGRWLAETQLSTASANLQSSIPHRGLHHYLQSLQGCRAMLLHYLSINGLPAAEAELLRKVVAHLEVLESEWKQIEEIYDLMPPSLVHGDFVTKNLRLRDTAAGPALLVFDWEYASWGVPATDLAQFTNRVASPDLSIYCSILRREHSHLNLRDVQAVAACGDLLHMVDSINWATAGYDVVLPPQLSPPQLSKVMSQLAWLEASMAEALTAFRMELT